MIELPSDESLQVLADWAEMSCVFHPTRPVVSRAEVDRVLDDAGITDAESTTSEIWREIDRRQQIAANHPVSVEQTRLVRQRAWDEALAYSFQLLIANHLNYETTRVSPGQWNITAKLFERLVATAISEYVGRSAIIVGAPREAPIPRGFKEALDYLCQALQEIRGRDLSISDDTKDDDLDLVSWISFDDMRPGHMMLFVQCAAGHNWREKTTDLSLDLWQDYLDWAVAPLRGFAFPFVPFEEHDWRRLSKEGGILFDRLRITSFYRERDDEAQFQQQLVDWCQGQVARLPWEH